MTILRPPLLLAAVLLLSFATVRAAEPLSPYGVCAHLARGDEHGTARQELRLMREAGIGWARADFSWTSVQRKAGGPWHFEHLDETLQWAEEEGVRILPILDYDTPWATPAYKHLDLWLEFVQRVVSRYKDRIRVWEVWNEPNLKNFWRDEPNAANYVTLLAATYKKIKQIDPQLIVLCGGTAGIPWDYLEGIYKAGGRESFDVMNIHPYRYPRSPEEAPLVEDLRRLRRMMTEYGDANKPIWITEVGWPTHQGKRGISLQRQAEILPRCYLLAIEAGVEVIFWYEFQATEHKPDYNENHFGMVHRDLSPKPAYTAMNALTTVRPAGSTRRDGTLRVGDVYRCSWTRPDRKIGWALWRPATATTVSLRMKGAVNEAVDHLGRLLRIEHQGDRVSLAIGEGPVYLIGPEQIDVLSAPDSSAAK